MRQRGCVSTNPGATAVAVELNRSTWAKPRRRVSYLVGPNGALKRPNRRGRHMQAGQKPNCTRPTKRVAWRMLHKRLWRERCANITKCKALKPTRKLRTSSEYDGIKNGLYLPWVLLHTNNPYLKKRWNKVVLRIRVVSLQIMCVLDNMNPCNKIKQKVLPSSTIIRTFDRAWVLRNVIDNE